MRIEMTLNELRAATVCQVNKGEFCNVVLKRTRDAKGETDTIISIRYSDDAQPRHAPIQQLLDFIR